MYVVSGTVADWRIMIVWAGNKGVGVMPSVRKLVWSHLFVLGVVGWYAVYL